MKVQVKRRDIRLGLPGKPSCCPIAIALNRATGDRWAVYDGYATKLFERPITHYPLPKSAVSFVRALDSGAKQQLDPFEFEFLEPSV